jgi:FkbM family methyltransferase
VPASASTLPAAFDQPRPATRGEHPLARRLRFVVQYAAWRRAVRELWRFKWREHRARGVLGAYHTRGRAIPYFIRHGTRDVGIFSEIFIAGDYDPPPAVTERLARLGRPPRILDLGANIGLFAASCRERWPGAQIVSVEPDPENLALLRRTAAATHDIEVLAACATDRDGSVRFVAGRFAESHVADAETAEETIEVPCIDALRLAGSADLVKIDIEGSEWEILADPRLASIDAQALVMEWHQERCPHPDPPRAAHAALRAACFDVLDERRPVPSNGTIWALRST